MNHAKPLPQQSEPCWPEQEHVMRTAFAKGWSCHTVCFKVQLPVLPTYPELDGITDRDGDFAGILSAVER